MTEQNIIEMLLKEANEGRYLNIVIILSVILLPVLAAWISKWLTNRKIEALYEARLRDKDQEIERLAATVKMLENKLLITQRPMTMLPYLLLALSFLALLSVAWDLRTVYRLHIAKKHDRILYRFCRVRDSIAELALDGRLPEESRIFQFFYTANALIIHNHKSAGLCFSDLLKEVDRSVEPSSDKDEGLEKLLREIRESDQEVRKLIDMYHHALFDAIISSLHLILVHRILRELSLDAESAVRTIGKMRIVPAWIRKIVLFWSQLRESGRSSHSTRAYA